MELTIGRPLPRSRAALARAVALRVVTTVAVFGLALFLRLSATAHLEVDFDEDDYLRAGQLYAGHLAAGNLQGVIDERANYEHPPLTKLVYGAILLGQGPAFYSDPVPELPTEQLPRGADLERVGLLALPLRQFSAIVGALTAGVVALVNPLAGLIVALSSWHVKYTSQAMLEALPCLFGALCLLMLRRSRRNGDVQFWLGAVALGLTAAGTYRYAAGGLAAVAWIMWRGVKGAAGKQTAWWSVAAMAGAWVGLALLVFYAADPALWPDPLGRLRASILYNSNYSVGKNVQQAGFPWFQPLLWLLGALPWNPGAVPLRLDGLFGLLALLALPRLWRAGGSQRLTALWFLANLGFLFFWPTKWPQYILALNVATALAASVWLTGLPTRLRERWPAPAEWRALGHAAPLLLPAGLVLLAAGLYPLLLQLGMAMSNFQAANIRPGQLAFWQAFGRGVVGLAPMQGNPLEYYGLGPIGLSGQLIVPVRFTILWVAATLALATALGLGLAQLLHRSGLRGRNAWRTLFMLPWAIPEFVSALVWQTIFDENFGALNNLTGGTTKWLSDPTPLLDLRPVVRPVSDLLNGLRLGPLGETLFFVAEGLSLSKPFWVLVFVSVWVSFPFMLLISSAALRSIPADVYEAARVDGASGWRLWRHITWPMIAPSIWAGVLLRGALLFNAFYLPQLLIGEANVNRTDTVSLALIGYFGAIYSNYSFAAFINTLVLIAVGALIWLFNRQTRVAEGVEY